MRHTPKKIFLAIKEKCTYSAFTTSHEVVHNSVVPRETRKEKHRMKTQTSHALAAKQIRQILKQAFPTTKFSVTSDSFAGGNAVDIRWTDGPTSKQVDALTSVYKMGHFDGMTDCYKYSNSRSDLPQVKFVQTHRSLSDNTVQRAYHSAKSHYADLADTTSVDDVFPHSIGMAWTGRTMFEAAAEATEASKNAGDVAAQKHYSYQCQQWAKILSHCSTAISKARGAK